MHTHLIILLAVILLLSLFKIIFSTKEPFENPRIITYAQLKTRQLEDTPYIPKLFFRTAPYTLENLPQKFRDIFNEMLDNNPDYTLCYFSDEDCVEFMHDHFKHTKYLAAYNALIPTAFKCDLWRLLALYIYGGVYNDSPHRFLLPLSKFIKKQDEFIVVRELPTPYAIHQAFFATKRHHPALMYIAEYIVDKRVIPRYKGTDSLDVTGPIIFGTALNSYLKRPEQTPYDVGNHEINNIKFRVFYLSLHELILDEKNTPILRTKFPEYSDLMYNNRKVSHYGTLWSQNTVFQD